MPKRILIVGGTGFIGAYITSRLLLDGHKIILATRDISTAQIKFPSCDVLPFDFNSIDLPALTQELKHIDIVINIGGVLNSTRKNDIRKVHYNGPKLLLDQSIKAKVKRFIHFSALGISDEKETEYSYTKREFDEYIPLTRNIDWVMLRPSLVYAQGSYGGTSLLRSLSVLPFFIPLIGEGKQKFQPIHIEDLAAYVSFLVKYNKPINKLFEVVGPDVVSVTHILQKLRSALGLRAAYYLNIPMRIISWAAKLGDFFGGPLSTTSLKMLNHPNTGNSSAIIKLTKIHPRCFDLGIETTPLTLQSLWHARLYLFKPIFIVLFAAFWIVTGLIPLVKDTGPAFRVIENLGVSPGVNYLMIFAGCGLDIILGFLLLFKRLRKGILIFQLLLVTLYTLAVTLYLPILWEDPLGSIMKNIPLILLIIFMLSIEDDK